MLILANSLPCLNIMTQQINKAIIDGKLYLKCKTNEEYFFHSLS